MSATDRSGMRTFLVVWLGQLVSVMGSALTAFGLGIWIFLETDSVTLLAFAVLAATVPGILIAPVAGALVDRWDRRRVMLFADIVAGLATLCAAILLAADSLHLWEIYLMVAVGSVAQAFQEPAYASSIPLLVGKEQLGRANGLVQMGQGLGVLVAPAIAGIVVATSGLWGVLVADFVTFAFAVGTLSIVRIPSPAAADPSDLTLASMRKDIVEGWTYLRVRRGLLGLLAVFAVINFLVGFANVLYIPFFLSVTTETMVGVVMSIGGVGMLAGSIVMGAWGGPQRRVVGILGLAAAGGGALLLIGLFPVLAIVAIGTFALMFCMALLNAMSQSLWQVKVAPEFQGRVFAVRRMLAQIAIPISYLLAGPLADSVFEPLMADTGALAGTVGTVIGTGTGRGIALMFVVMGLGTIAAAAVAAAYPPIRNLESDLPDMVGAPAPEPIGV